MERPLTLKPLSIQDENSVFPRKKPTVEGKSKSSRPLAKKGGIALESRKALNDITNKKSNHPEASSQKKGSQNIENNKCNIVEGHKHHHILETEALPEKKSSLPETLNIAEEGFLHDHNKCMQAQKSALELNFWDIVLPGHGSAHLIVEKAESKPENNAINCCQELKELSMPKFSDSWYKSPPSSPIRWDSPPPSPFTWDLQPIELMFKEDSSGNIQ